MSKKKIDPYRVPLQRPLFTPHGFGMPRAEDKRLEERKDGKSEN